MYNSKLNRFFKCQCQVQHTYVTHKHLVFMTLNRNINWLKSTYVNLHCAGINTKCMQQWYKHIINTLQTFIYFPMETYHKNIIVEDIYVSQIVYYAGEKNFNFIANTFDIIRNNFPTIVRTYIESFEWYTSYQLRFCFHYCKQLCFD